ncbi:unnamed protein product [Protopolystoma xenopodis]|uniref:ShKT domain-containing protein n=1 Tax=Protopolystoma xenopodis TaxID=117903 RepID=A0A3S5C385_9PLAT|nr:unnamed protein product [Protopolystoma xenopodis]
MEEICAEAGITRLAWRVKLQCPLTCGANKVFTDRLESCPRTCENHFFGTRKDCYSLPGSEGCQCNPGFLLDGMKCVKPENCRCLEGCRDVSSRCSKWAAEGKCQTNMHIMNEVCRNSCGFCKQIGESVVALLNSQIL